MSAMVIINIEYCYNDQKKCSFYNTHNLIRRYLYSLFNNPADFNSYLSRDYLMKKELFGSY